MTGRWKRYLSVRLALQICAALVLSLAISASAEAQSVRVVHGIPGLDVSPALDPELPVDILVNDAICLLSGFAYGEVAGPFSIPEGTYNLKVGLANTLAPCSGDPVLDADIPIGAGENVSLVAHLTADGAPTASKFVNDVSAPMAGNVRVIAHHVAAAPEVDLLIPAPFFGNPILRVNGVSNTAGMNQAAAEITEAAAAISILPPGGTQALFTRVVDLKPGLTYLVYAIGSLENGTFTLLVHPVGGLKGFTVRF